MVRLASEVAVVKCIANPDAALVGLIEFVNPLNPFYGGRDQRWTKNKIMSTKQEAIGILEAADAVTKAVGQLGKPIAAHVIARPHNDPSALLPK